MDPEVKLKHIGDALDQLASDTSIPRNIRRGAKEAKDILNDTPTYLSTGGL
jgi:uncharacterized protein (UPF0147 family)